MRGAKIAFAVMALGSISALGYELIESSAPTADPELASFIAETAIWVPVDLVV